MRCSEPISCLIVLPSASCYSLHLGIQSGPCEDELIRLDEAYVQNRYKVSNTLYLTT